MNTYNGSRDVALLENKTWMENTIVAVPQRSAVAEPVWLGLTKLSLAHQTNILILILTLQLK